MTTERTNIVYSTSIPKADGQPAALTVLKYLSVNNTPRVNKVKEDLWAINFPSNLTGDFKLKGLEFALNGAQLKRTEYGVSVNVTVFAHTEKQAEYYEKAIQKGSRLDVVVGNVKIDKFGTKFVVERDAIGFINKPGTDSHPHQETAKVEQKATMAEVIEAEENDCGI